MTVKMPEPMTAPMPRAVSDQGPSDFLSACSGSSDSRISLSMDLQASSWLGSAVLLFEGPAGVNLPGPDDFDHWIKDGKAYAAVYMKLRYAPRAEYGLTRSRRTALKAGTRRIKQISKSQRAGCAAGPHEKRDSSARGEASASILRAPISSPFSCWNRAVWCAWPSVPLSSAPCASPFCAQSCLQFSWCLPLLKNLFPSD